MTERIRSRLGAAMLLIMCVGFALGVAAIR